MPKATIGSLLRHVALTPRVVCQLQLLPRIRLRSAELVQRSTRDAGPSGAQLKTLLKPSTSTVDVLCSSFSYACTVGLPASSRTSDLTFVRTKASPVKPVILFYATWCIARRLLICCEVVAAMPRARRWTNKNRWSFLLVATEPAVRISAVVAIWKFKITTATAQYFSQWNMV